MTDILVVGLLLVIVLILVSSYCFEVLVYIVTGICIIVLVILMVMFVTAFIHDPVGTLSAIATGFIKEIMDAMPDITVVNTL